MTADRCPKCQGSRIDPTTGGECGCGPVPAGAGPAWTAGEWRIEGFFIELRRISGAVRPPRFDLALAACQVAAASGELDVAQAFAQTAIDFMTGTYEPFEDEPTQ